MIREVCSCSAEIETDEDDALAIVKEWRKKHIHQMPQSNPPTFSDVASNHEIAPGFSMDRFPFDE